MNFTLEWATPPPHRHGEHTNNHYLWIHKGTNSGRQQDVNYTVNTPTTTVNTPIATICEHIKIDTAIQPLPTERDSAMDTPIIIACEHLKVWKTPFASSWILTSCESHRIIWRRQWGTRNPIQFLDRAKNKRAHSPDFFSFCCCCCFLAKDSTHANHHGCEHTKMKQLHSGVNTVKIPQLTWTHWSIQIIYELWTQHRKRSRLRQLNCVVYHRQHTRGQATSSFMGCWHIERCDSNRVSFK